MSSLRHQQVTQLPQRERPGSFQDLKYLGLGSRQPKRPQSLIDPAITLALGRLDEKDELLYPIHLPKILDIAHICKYYVLCHINS